MNTSLDGGCACGDVRYRVVGDPIFVNNCHCRLCQRQNGAASAVNAFFESDRVTLLSGSLSEHSVKTGSGGEQVIVRCAKCGTAVWSHYPSLGRAGAAVRTGTLDDPNVVRPDAAIYIDYRPEWVAVPEGVPAFPETYRAAELLPAERLARLRALAAKAKS